MREQKHKALVDAIIDGEVEAAEIAKRAVELGGSLAARLNTLTRAIVKARSRKAITAAQAKEAYVAAFRALSLVGFTSVAQDVLDHADKVAGHVGREAKALGENVQTVQAIRKPDFMARELEKRGINGNIEATSPTKDS